MKKAILFGIIFGTMIGNILAQQVTDTIPIVHTAEESIMDFLKVNAWNLALIVFLLVSEWLGSTGKVKEGSVYAWIINMIGKIIRSKTDIVKTKKAKFMTTEEMKFSKLAKTIIAIMILSGIGLTASAQGGWKITKEDFKVSEAQALKMNQPFYSADPTSDSVFVKRRMFIRTAADAAFMNLTYDKDLKAWNTEFLSLIGYGVTFQWYTLENNLVIPTWGVTPMIMTNTGAFEDVAASRLYFGAVGSYRGLLTLGLNVDLKTGKVGVMPGVQLTF